jgi:hypothetical protein
VRPCFACRSSTPPLTTPFRLRALAESEYLHLTRVVANDAFVRPCARSLCNRSRCTRRLCNHNLCTRRLCNNLYTHRPCNSLYTRRPCVSYLTRVPCTSVINDAFTRPCARNPSARSPGARGLCVPASHLIYSVANDISARLYTHRECVSASPWGHLSCH